MPARVYAEVDGSGHNALHRSDTGDGGLTRTKFIYTLYIEQINWHKFQMIRNILTMQIGKISAMYVIVHAFNS